MAQSRKIHSSQKTHRVKSVPGQRLSRHIGVKESTDVSEHEGKQRGETLSGNHEGIIEKITRDEEGGKKNDQSKLTYKDVKVQGKQKKVADMRGEDQKTPSKSRKQEVKKSKATKERPKKDASREISSAESEQTVPKKSSKTVGKTSVQSSDAVRQKRNTTKKVDPKGVKMAEEQIKSLGEIPQSSRTSKQQKVNLASREALEKKALILEMGREEVKRKGLTEVQSGSGAAKVSNEERNVSSQKSPVAGESQERTVVFVEPDISPTKLLSEEGSRMLVFLRKMFVSRPGTVQSAEELDSKPKEKLEKKPPKKTQRVYNQRPLHHVDPDQFIIPLLDVFLYSEKMDPAQFTFNSCTHHGTFKDIRVYNMLLEGWARKGNIDAVKKIFVTMSAGDMPPNLESFASVLECIGRRRPIDGDLAGRCINDMEKAGLTLDDLGSVKFKRDSREVVLEVVRAARPDYEQPPPPERPLCTLKVVKDLYCEPSHGKGLRNSLSGIFSNEELREKMDLQWQTEQKECISIKSIDEETHPSQHVCDKRESLAEHKGMWRRALKKGLGIQKRKKRYQGYSVAHQKIHPFLTVLNDDDYVQLMLEVLPKFASTSEGISTLQLARELGSRVNQRYIIRKKRKDLIAIKTRKLYLDYMEHLMNSTDGDPDHRTHRELWQHLLDQNPEGPSLDFETPVWPSSIVLKIGNFLADILLREIQIDARSKSEKKFIPGLYHMYAYRSMKQVGFLKPHPLLIDLFQGAKDPDLPFDSNILPMVTPPLPWMSTRFGGYPLSSTKLMRCKEGTSQAKLLSEKANTPELHPVLDSLNQLSAVPWIVNKKMLDMIIDVFRKEGSKELDIPQPSSVFPAPPPIRSNATPEEIAQIHQERAVMRKTQAEMHALRMDMLYKLSIANHFRDQVFWFPHNMDFRGRVYPCPPHFNHLGSDVTRGLLLFAQGRPLGDEGLDWLKIHLINLSGHKKRVSLKDRLAYADEILPDILDSAERPFEGKKWWQTTDEPWQALACCIEIADALSAPDPAKYVSHLPIHQDGSCNGLQHYAALGRDVIGAEQVNLHPFPVPQDVYSGVAQMVEEHRKKDADSGMKIAAALEGAVQRKVVKQTVMTVVYGVTTFGGRHQIYRQLKDMEIMSEEDAWFASAYLVAKVFQSLGTMFAKTREIQDWLTESAYMIAKGGSSIEWVTPLGLPIDQPYHKKSQVYVSSTEKWALYHNDSTNSKSKPDAQKQKNAFPPNFIHSLDSTHMMLTSLNCQRAGITFASVHDCFWTHASSVDVMNKICREQFVRLHEQPILHDLARFLTEKFGDIVVDPGVRTKTVNPTELTQARDYLKRVPDTGNFDLKNVLDSTYFFS